MKPCTTIQRLRKPKILDMSIFDWVTSLLGAAIVAYYMHVRGYINLTLFFIAWTLTGILIHAEFGVNTMLGYYVGLNPKPKREECA